MPATISQEFLAKAGAALFHRGPDHQGTWFDPTVNVGLGHRRLAILDLSPQGQQPMQSADGRYVLTFNGEIYNFAELKADLLRLGHGFRGTSDTEVMLAAFSQWGLEAAIQKCVGMFAFALWDRADQVLSLCRDRFGEKPLYYGWLGSTFLFGSELKALQAHPLWQGLLNRPALALLLRYSYIPAPHSIYQNIYKLPPGTWLRLESGNPSSRPTPQRYWSMSAAIEQGQQQPFSGGEAAAITQLENLLQSTMRQQMVADVPLGAFLSGGLDSSTVVALMQSQSRRPIKTFTVGFQEAAYNEAQAARAVAHHLGTDHTELYVTPTEAQAIIPQLSTLYDEPFADPSQIPTFLISQLAKQQVTVSLSGDGGDEIFGGYNRYLWADRLWRKVGWLPPVGRRAIAQLIKQRSPQAWDSSWKNLPFLPAQLQQRLPGEKLHKLANALAASTPEMLYTRLVSHWDNPFNLVQGIDQEAATVLSDRTPWSATNDFIPWMMYLDTQMYLPGDILTKVDRAAMGVSLETRIPFLDHRVVEFAQALPMSYKIRQGKGKWLLRQVLNHYVPTALIDRPKMGFSVPISDWLRGPLRDWGGDLLNQDRLKSQGFLNAEPVHQAWLTHLSGAQNLQYPLWNVLCFQAWLDTYDVS
jgi:asparagine synthase (glutamine-hydrolysing)